MRISTERMMLVSGDAATALGVPTYIDNQASLSALTRALVIEHGETDIEKIKEKSSVCLSRVSSDASAIDVFANAIGITVVETTDGYFPDSSFTVEGWRSLDSVPFPVNKYLSQFGKTMVLVNEEKQLVVAFVERRARTQWLQAFMSVFPRILTWYFPLELTPEHQEFYTAISVGNSKISEAEAAEKFVEYVNSFYGKVDFRTAALHKQLDGHADKLRLVNIENTKAQIRNVLRAIKNYQTNLITEYKKLETNQLTLKAMESISSEPDNRLFEFFDMHKQLTVLWVDDSDLQFGIAETIEYYDEDEFNAMIENPQSYLCRNSYVCDDPDMKMLLKAIFSERRGVIYTNSVFRLSSMRYVDVRGDETFIANAMPHPHLVFYGCLGTNSQYLDQYAETGEWDLSIEQAIAATKNLNFGDSTVVNHMIDWMAQNKNNVKCIYVDGDNSKLYTIQEFIDILKKGE